MVRERGERETERQRERQRQRERERERRCTSFLVSIPIGTLMLLNQVLSLMTSLNLSNFLTPKTASMRGSGFNI